MVNTAPFDGESDELRASLTAAILDLARVEASRVSWWMFDSRRSQSLVVSRLAVRLGDRSDPNCILRTAS
jgi:hypothetical protein